MTRVSKHADLISLFIQCIDETRYYDAHEVFEEVWFPRRFEDDAEMKLLKGFINAAVSFELIKRGRPESSKKVWKNYEKYKILLGTFQSPHNGAYQELSRYLEEKRDQLISN